MRISQSIINSITIRMTLILIIIALAQSLKISTHQKITKTNHLQTTMPSNSGQNIYDQQRYLVELAQRQNSFKQKLIEIQNDFVGINLMLNDTNLNKQQKTIKLNQALADQRDVMFQAQTQINLPYQLKSCQCVKLNQQKKKDIQSQLLKVNTKIQDIQKVATDIKKTCKNNRCPLKDQINNQLKQLLNYQKIMQDTITSKCCEIIKYAYRDNLDVSNWHFGNTSQSQYQAQIFQRQQQQNITLQPCPYQSPFVQVKSNQCFACPPQSPLFNLGTRKCQADCSSSSGNQSYVLNLAIHVCGLNSNCPNGQYFDSTINKCVLSSTTQGNQSSCPPSKPFWDPLSYSCQNCPSQTPFFDTILKKCRSCDKNETWSESLRICQISNQSCNSGFTYNSITNQCQQIDNSTHSLCPPYSPFWNEVTYSCDKCPNSKPFYDSKQQTCRECLPTQVYNDLKKQCIRKSQNITCLSTQSYNPKTNSCQPLGTTSMCPPQTPFWDSNLLKCLQCPNNFPYFNPNTNACQNCPIQQVWSTQLKTCVQQCGNAQLWNIKLKKCIKTNQSCPVNNVWSIDTNTCVQVNCSNGQFWNQSNKQCQACPQGTVFNYVTNNCDNSSQSGNASVCHQDKPLWNPDYLRCDPCPQGTKWNDIYLQCISPSANNHHKYSHSFQKNHMRQQSQTKVEDHVYGNSQISYQHHSLKK